jgi:hypothetical protein
VAVSVLLRTLTDERNEHRREETLKLYFKCFKHLTTLNTATALVVLAIYRDTSLSDLAISAFSVSLITSLYGILSIPQSKFIEGEGFSLSLLLIAASVVFFIGVFAAFVAVYLIYGERSTLFFWMGIVLALYGFTLWLYPHVRSIQEWLSRWRNR